MNTIFKFFEKVLKSSFGYEILGLKTIQSADIYLVTITFLFYKLLKSYKLFT